MTVPSPIAAWPSGWWAACRSRDLGRRPAGAVVHGTPIVLFRTANGAAAALEDRCPHRMAPLSLGRVCAGAIECPYHGWQFDAMGRCVAIPGLAAGERTGHATRTVPSMCVVETGGLVFVSAAAETPSPYLGPLVFDAETPSRAREPHHAFVWRAQARGALVDIAENFLDGFHTHYVHAGLIRSASVRQRVLARVRRSTDRVEIEYAGEEKQSGLISRLFEKQRTTTFARFVRPGVAELEYRSRARIELTITAYFTPAANDAVTIFAVIAAPGNAVTGRLKEAAITPFFWYALRQDRRIVELQRASIARWGGARYTSTRLDVMRPHIARLLERDVLPAGFETVHEEELLL